MSKWIQLRIFIITAALMGAALLMFGILISGYFDRFGHIGQLDQTQLGQLGDYIGGIVNPVVAMLALFALLLTLSLQYREFSQTRKELTKAAKAQEQMLENSKLELVETQKQAIGAELIRALGKVEGRINFLRGVPLKAMVGGKEKSFEQTEIGRDWVFGSDGKGNRLAKSRLGTDQKQIRTDHSIGSIALAVLQASNILAEYANKVGKTQMWELYITQYGFLAQDCCDLNLFTHKEETIVQNNLINEAKSIMPQLWTTEPE